MTDIRFSLLYYRMLSTIRQAALLPKEDTGYPITCASALGDGGLRTHDIARRPAQCQCRVLIRQQRHQLFRPLVDVLALRLRQQPDQPIRQRHPIRHVAPTLGHGGQRPLRSLRDVPLQHLSGIGRIDGHDRFALRSNGLQFLVQGMVEQLFVETGVEHIYFFFWQIVIILFNVYCHTIEHHPGFPYQQLAQEFHIALHLPN